MLDPSFVTGFCEGEASFVIAKTNSGYRPHFAIKLRYDDGVLLNEFMAFFGGGKIYYYENKPFRKHYSPKRRPYCFYKVTKASDLYDKIIPHFEKHPLRGKKVKIFGAWKEIVYLIVNKQHLTQKGKLEEKVGALRRMYQ